MRGIRVPFGATSSHWGRAQSPGSCRETSRLRCCGVGVRLSARLVIFEVSAAAASGGRFPSIQDLSFSSRIEPCFCLIRWYLLQMNVEIQFCYLLVPSI